MSKKRPARSNGTKIEKVAVPPRSKYQFNTLPVDESFIEEDLSKEGSLRAAASRAGRKLNRTFRVVTEVKDGRYILRCGRTA